MQPRNLCRWRLAFLSSLGLLPACGEAADDADVGVLNPGRNNPDETSDGGPSGGVEPHGDRPSAMPNRPTESPPRDGLLRSTDGLLHRAAPAQCTSEVPRPEPDELIAMLGDEAPCHVDADCTDKPHGFCMLNGVQVLNPECRYGCLTDADCEAGTVCHCGSPVGECIPASCTTDADCPGQHCGYHEDPGMCSDGVFLVRSYACTTDSDECVAATDCGTPDYEHRCSLEDGIRTCSARGLCGIGRPFLVDGAARVASVSEGSPWCDAAMFLSPSGSGSLCTLRDVAIGNHWLRVGLMEHASVAAFSRFAMQLLSVGAPASLVQATASAMADEIAHARSCFAFASSHLGRRVGPGPLTTDGVGANTRLEEVLVNCVLEGCIGETVAAIEAEACAANATDPLVADTLRRISDDERRHAELAWQFVHWVLQTRPEFAPLIQSTVADIIEETRAAACTTQTSIQVDETEQLRAGLLPDRHRRRLKRDVLQEVISPCVQALTMRQAA